MIKVDLTNIFSDATAMRVAQARKDANVTSSPLMQLKTLLRTVDQSYPFSLTLSKSPNCCFERYACELGSFTIILVLRSYGINKTDTGLVRHPCTALQLQSLTRCIYHAASMQNTELTLATITKLAEMPQRAFNLVSTSCVFQTEIDDAEWHVRFSDARNRCGAELSVLLNALV